MSCRNNIAGLDRGPLVGGVVLIVVGTVLLLEKLGYLPSGFALHFWPLIFIVIGIVKIIYADGRAIGSALIAVGILLQLQQSGILHVEFWQLWPAFLIIAGVVMLFQTMVRPPLPDISPNSSSPNPIEEPGSENPEFDSAYVFGGAERHINTKNFRSGRLFAMFGGYKIDFRHADMQGDSAVIEANAFFGGGEIIVPEHWFVSMHGVGIFGGYTDKTRHFQPDPSKPTKTLVVKGMAMFGGVEVKN